MVVMFLSAALPTGATHERAGLPSMITVHAPQRPSPQPYFVPVRSSWSRRTLSSGTSGSTFTGTRRPFMANTVTLGIGYAFDFHSGASIISLRIVHINDSDEGRAVPKLNAEGVC